MRLKVIILFLFLTQNVMASEEVVLRINESTVLYGTFLNENEFLKIKPNLELINSKPFKRSISRTYNYNNKYTVFEFFNKCAIRFDKIVEQEELVNVEFDRVLFSSQKNEVTYVIGIEEIFFQSLQKEIISKVEIEELDFFGKFHNLKNGNVLAKWSHDYQPFQPSKFSILKNIRAIAAIDFELISIFDQEKNSTSIEREKEIDFEYEPFEFGEDIDVKSNNLRDRLSKLLNIEKSNLDFSLESVDLIEHSIYFNCDQINKYELLALCFPYIGETARRKYNLNWIKEDGQMKLVDEKFNPLNFGFNLSDGIVHTDYLPTVRWTIEQLETDLKRK